MSEAILFELKRRIDLLIGALEVAAFRLNSKGELYCVRCGSPADMHSSRVCEVAEALEAVSDQRTIGI